MSDAMIFGAFLPQGWKMELAAIDGAEAKWAKAVEIAVLAEELGYDSIWVYDHFHNVPRPAHEAVFECWTTMAAISQRTSRIRLGQMVGCNSYRNPGCSRRSRRLSTSSAAAASTGASAPAGTRTSTRATATSSRGRRSASACCARRVEIVKSMWTEPETTLRGPLLQRCTARTATPSRCSSRIRRSGSVAAASSSPCGSSPATPTARTSAASPTSGRTSASVLKGHCKDVGRDYDEIRKTWSPEVFIRETEAEVEAAASRSLWGEPSSRGRRATSSARPSRSPRRSSAYRRPRLSRLRARGAPTIPTPRRSTLLAEKVMPQFR